MWFVDAKFAAPCFRVRINANSLFVEPQVPDITLTNALQIRRFSSAQTARGFPRSGSSATVFDARVQPLRAKHKIFIRGEMLLQRSGEIHARRVCTGNRDALRKPVAVAGFRAGRLSRGDEVSLSSGTREDSWAPRMETSIQTIIPCKMFSCCGEKSCFMWKLGKTAPPARGQPIQRRPVRFDPSQLSLVEAEPRGGQGSRSCSLR